MNATLQNTTGYTPKPKRAVNMQLPADLVEWLERRSIVTGDSKTQIIKHLIRGAIKAEKNGHEI